MAEAGLASATPATAQDNKEVSEAAVVEAGLGVEVAEAVTPAVPEAQAVSAVEAEAEV